MECSHEYMSRDTVLGSHVSHDERRDVEYILMLVSAHSYLLFGLAKQLCIMSSKDVTLVLFSLLSCNTFSSEMNVCSCLKGNYGEVK